MVLRIIWLTSSKVEYLFVASDCSIDGGATFWDRGRVTIPVVIVKK